MSFFRRLFGRQESKVGPNSLRDTNVAFVNAKSWDESQRIVEQHPELLNSAADEQIAQLLNNYAGNPNAVQLLTEHRTLLRRCREAGIARAFAEKKPNGLV